MAATVLNDGDLSTVLHRQNREDLKLSADLGTLAALDHPSLPARLVPERGARAARRRPRATPTGRWRRRRSTPSSASEQYDFDPALVELEVKDGALSAVRPAGVHRAEGVRRPLEEYVDERRVSARRSRASTAPRSSSTSARPPTSPAAPTASPATVSKAQCITPSVPVTCAADALLQEGEPGPPEGSDWRRVRPRCSPTATSASPRRRDVRVGCPGSYITDDYRDDACNNEACGFDGGDCGVAVQPLTVAIPTTWLDDKTIRRSQWCEVPPMDPVRAPASVRMARTTSGFLPRSRTTSTRRRARGPRTTRGGTSAAARRLRSANRCARRSAARRSRTRSRTRLGAPPAKAAATCSCPSARSSHLRPLTSRTRRRAPTSSPAPSRRTG